MQTRFFLFFAAIVAALVSFAGCQASGSATGHGTLQTPLGPVNVDINASLNQAGSFNMNNSSSLCFELSFFNAAGAKIGSATITPGPNSGPVPAGTSKWSAASVPCPQAGHGRAHGGHLQEYPGASDFTVFGMPIDFDANDPTANAVYSFVVHARNSTEAAWIASAQIHRPVGSAIDPRISVGTLLQTVVGQTGVSIVSLSGSRAASFEMDVNGHANYATLGAGSSVVHFASGTWGVEAPVWYGDINAYGSWNEVAVRASTVDNPAVQTTDVAMLYTP